METDSRLDRFVIYNILYERTDTLTDIPGLQETFASGCDFCGLPRSSLVALCAEESTSFSGICPTAYITATFSSHEEMFQPLVLSFSCKWNVGGKGASTFVEYPIYAPGGELISYFFLSRCVDIDLINV